MGVARIYDCGVTLSRMPVVVVYCHPSVKGQFQLPEFTARVHGPSTRVVETDLKGGRHA